MAYDSSLGRQTSALSFIVNRPADEPGFRLERQDKADRQMRYTLHPYAQEEPVGRRYGERRATSGLDARPIDPAAGCRFRTRRWHVSAAGPPAASSGRCSERSDGDRARWPPGGVHEVLEQLDRELVALGRSSSGSARSPRCWRSTGCARRWASSSQRPTLHMSFTGSPGTGKTTVALRMADILHRLGYIEKGHLVSVTRDDLVGQYVGHTAPKTKDVVKRALGGILFIDEAYYLHRPENERDYGQEAIEVLLQVMESERQNLVVVMAGYKEPMEAFFQCQPRDGSRVAHHIDFPDYDVDELMQIARLMVGSQGYELRDDAAEALRRLHRAARSTRPRFAHGRSIRNAVERARMRQATRLFDSDREAHQEGPDHARGRATSFEARCSATPRSGRRSTDARPVILGVVGDSAAGKTTITRGLVRVLGEDRVTHVCTDDYHRYDRKQRAEHGITPLDPGLQLRGHHGPAPAATCAAANRSSSRSTTTPTGPSGRRST